MQYFMHVLLIGLPKWAVKFFTSNKLDKWDGKQYKQLVGGAVWLLVYWLEGSLKKDLQVPPRKMQAEKIPPPILLTILTIKYH